MKSYYCCSNCGKPDHSAKGGEDCMCGGNYDMWHIQATCLNLLAHDLTLEQVIDLQEYDIMAVTPLSESGLSMEAQAFIRQTPKIEGDEEEIYQIMSIFSKYDYVLLPGGSPALMWTIARRWVDYAITGTRTKFLFAYSKRESMDTPQSDGSVKKMAVFRHQGFQVL